LDAQTRELMQSELQRIWLESRHSALYITHQIDEAIFLADKVDEQLVRCARCFGATDRQLFRTIALPSMLPFLIAGMKLAVGRALVGVLVGELVASSDGVGHMMAVAGATFQTDKNFVGVVLLAVVGWSLTAFFQSIEGRLTQWKTK
jgi:NitT/TauT family transport system permease protein